RGMSRSMAYLLTKIFGQEALEKTPAETASAERLKNLTNPYYETAKYLPQNDQDTVTQTTEILRTLQNKLFDATHLGNIKGSDTYDADVAKLRASVLAVNEALNHQLGAFSQKGAEYAEKSVLDESFKKLAEDYKAATKQDLSPAFKNEDALVELQDILAELANVNKALSEPVRGGRGQQRALEIRKLVLTTEAKASVARELGTIFDEQRLAARAASTGIDAADITGLQRINPKKFIEFKKIADDLTAQLALLTNTADEAEAATKRSLIKSFKAAALSLLEVEDTLKGVNTGLDKLGLTKIKSEVYELFDGNTSKDLIDSISAATLTTIQLNQAYEGGEANLGEQLRLAKLLRNELSQLEGALKLSNLEATKHLLAGSESAGFKVATLKKREVEIPREALRSPKDFIKKFNEVNEARLELLLTEMTQAALPGKDIDLKTPVDRLAKAEKQMTSFTDSTVANVLTLEDTFQKLDAVFSTEDLLGMSPETFEGLVRAGIEMNNVANQIEKLGLNATKTQFDKLLLRKLAAIETGFRATVGLIGSTGSKINEMFTGGDIRQDQIQFISDDTIDALRKSEKSVARLTHDLTKKENVSKFVEINEELAKAERTSKKILDNLSTRGGREELLSNRLGYSREEASNFDDKALLERSAAGIIGAQRSVDLDARILGAGVKSGTSGAVSAAGGAISAAEGSTNALLKSAAEASTGAARALMANQSGFQNDIKDLFAFNRRAALEPADQRATAKSARDQAFRVSPEELNTILGSLGSRFSDLDKLSGRMLEADRLTLASKLGELRVERRKFDANITDRATFEDSEINITDQIAALISKSVYALDTQSLASEYGIAIDDSVKSMINAGEKAYLDGMLNGLRDTDLAADAAITDAGREAAATTVELMKRNLADQ
ncbi:MAG: hypothetical protein DRR06_19990, partial [Gammaproteobacteria bacterium]